MKQSISDHNLYIDSEEEEEEEREEDNKNGEVEVYGNDSDNSSMYSIANQQESRAGSFNPSWPQSYRQSMDLYSSVPSPSIAFLGTPLSRISNSFISSSLTRRHTPEILPSLSKPLLPSLEDEHQPLPSRKSSVQKIAEVSHELPVSRQSSFGQAVLNGMNVLCGVGILSTPYAVKEGGWFGMSILFIFAVLSLYTGILLRHCLDSQPGLETYPDIGQAAFGTYGRFAISIVLYLELYACCVEYIILESDNLSSLFPNAHLSLGVYELNSHHLFALLTTLTILPTVWLRDLSVLSYISAFGVLASILVVLCLFWAGFVDKLDFHTGGSSLNLSTLPVAIGLYGYCYSGHAVFPNIYTSMKKPNQYSAVLFTSFCICTVMYAGVAVLGYLMFGESTLSQFTLNMPQNLVASKVALWTTVVNPLTKYALTMTPVALALEELIPSNQLKSHIYAICIRTTLVMSTLLVALFIPFFGLVMALIGSLFTMLVTLIFPCACFIRILGHKVTRIQVAVCISIIIVGIISAIFGSYSALSQIIENLG